ncbi:DUF3817 domain-containing protein [Streptomyces sp. NPDC018029]|uniref:DUF3817 domain-containing protein n=1 Tax=Streptomyces sp. NPDC018029 TaxID=3365032 RepID=UPI0037932FB9
MTAVLTLRTLRIAAGAEAVSLALLLTNLFTIHARPLSSLLGPLHGTAYLVVIAATWMLPTAVAQDPGASRASRWRALVPGIGGLLAMRRLKGRA